MATASTFVKNTTISSAELIDMFQIAGGAGSSVGSGYLPRDGVSLATTNGTLNTGSDTVRWSTLFCNNIAVATGGHVKKAINLIGEVTVSVAAEKIEFTGLSGDDDNIYIMNVSTNHSAPSVTTRIYIHFNGDSSGSNYGFENLLGQGAAVSATRDTAEPGMLLEVASSGVTTAAHRTATEVLIFAKTGIERFGLIESMNGGQGTHIQRADVFGCLWNDTSSTITSIQLTSALTGYFDVGTNVQLWAKR